MPGPFWKRAIGTVLGSFLWVDLMATPESVTKMPVDHRQVADHTPQKDGFRFFKKTPSVATSVIVRVYEHGKLVGFLLVDRGRPPLGPALPGGIVRYKESPEKCLKRTLFDECGISSVSNVQQFKIYSDPARDPRMHAVDISYSVRVDDQKISSGTDAKHVWICPLEKIPWDRLVFDHKNMLKAYLEHLIASSDRVERTEKIQLGSATKNGVRNKSDFENVAKQAYRPPYLFVAGIIEVYEGNEFKGIALANFQQEQTVKLLPAGGIAYGETAEQAFQKHMQGKYQAEVHILGQFKAYSFFNDAGKKHDITIVFLAKTDKKALGSLRVYALDEILSENLGFHHKDIIEDYLKYRKGESVDTFSVCPPYKGLSK